MNSLAHHGIRGQKWGKRNGPPYPLRESAKSYTEKKRALSSSTKQKKGWSGLTKDQKNTIIKGSLIAASALAIAGSMYIDYKLDVLNPIHVDAVEIGKRVNLSDLSTNILSISKNTPLQRITSSPEDMVTQGKAIFASYLKRDNAIYKQTMGDFIKDWQRNGIIPDDKVIVNKIKLKRDIRIASDRDTARAYLKANKVNDDYIDAGRYSQFMDLLGDRDTNPIVKEFVSILKQEGFDGIIDYNDAGHFTTYPLYLFDPSQIVSSVSSHNLGKIEKFINLLLG